MSAELDANEEYEALLEFVYLCPVGLAQLDSRGGVEMMNSAGARIMMEIATRPGVENLFDALGTAGEELRMLSEGLTADQGTVCEAHRVTFNVPRRATPLVLSITLLKLSPTRTMAVFADESASAAQERAARKAEQRVRAVFDGVRDYAIFALDRNCLVESWNKSAERLFGYPTEEAIGREYFSLFPRDPSSSARLAGLVSGAVEGGWSEDEGWWARKETTRFWGSSVVSLIEDEDGSCTGYIVVTRDLTRKKREEDELRDAATKDFLTGLSNRRAFEEAAGKELQLWRRGRETLSVVIIDADHFKRVNDTYGHGTGDSVLKAIARAVQDQVRDTDLAARLGGEEFVVLLPSTDASGARAAAERIRIAVEGLRVTAPDGSVVRVTVSAGVAEVARELGTIELLLERADEGLYEAKSRGRNRSVIAHARTDGAAREVA